MLRAPFASGADPGLSRPLPLRRETPSSLGRTGLQRADDAAGVADGDAARGDRPRHHAPGADNAVRADRPARQHDRAAADPGARADAYRLRALEPLLSRRWVERVVGGEERPGRAYLGARAEGDGRAVEEPRVEVDECPLAEADVRAVVTGERRD